MSVYKEEKTGTWRVLYRYTDWTGEKKQTQKRGFKTKREAQAWEREQLNKVESSLDMTFESFAGRYREDEESRRGKHLGDEKSHHRNKVAALLWQAENGQYYPAADHHLAERAAEL